MKRKPLVSVLVHTRNSERTIRKHLESIKNQSYPRVEIIVVDNNSIDTTKEVCQQFTKKVFNYGPERSAQRNYAAKKAKGDYYLVPDSDMMLSRHVVKKCVELVMKRPEIKEVVIPEKSVGQGFWVKVKSFERSFYFGEKDIEAARFFEKKVFWEVGGYDEKITGPEDWDLPQRIAAKYPVGRIKAHINHDEGAMSWVDYAHRKYYYAQGLQRYLRQQSKGLIGPSTIYFLRPAFYRNWKKLVSKPTLSLAMIWLLTAEQVSGLLGYLKSGILRGRDD